MAVPAAIPPLVAGGIGFIAGIFTGAKVNDLVTVAAIGGLVYLVATKG